MSVGELTAVCDMVPVQVLRDALTTIRSVSTGSRNRVIQQFTVEAMAIGVECLVAKLTLELVWEVHSSYAASLPARERKALESSIRLAKDARMALEDSIRAVGLVAFLLGLSEQALKGLCAALGIVTAYQSHSDLQEQAYEEAVLLGTEALLDMLPKAQLVAWCAALGLRDGGKRSALVERLVARIYNLEPTADPELTAIMRHESLTASPMARLQVGEGLHGRDAFERLSQGQGHASPGQGEKGKKAAKGGKKKSKAKKQVKKRTRSPTPVKEESEEAEASSEEAQQPLEPNEWGLHAGTTKQELEEFTCKDLRAIAKFFNVSLGRARKSDMVDILFDTVQVAAAAQGGPKKKTKTTKKTAKKAKASPKKPVRRTSRRRR